MNSLFPLQPFLAIREIDGGEEVRKWLRTHLRDASSRPGVLSASAYATSDDGKPAFIVMYALHKASIDLSLDAAAPQDARNPVTVMAPSFGTAFALNAPPLTLPLGPVLMIPIVTVDESRSEEFNRWYGGTHLPEAMFCPGFRAGARYQFVDKKSMSMTLYVLDHERAAESSELKAIAGWHQFTDVVRHRRRLYRPLEGL